MITVFGFLPLSLYLWVLVCNPSRLQQSLKKSFWLSDVEWVYPLNLLVSAIIFQAFAARGSSFTVW